MSASSGLTTIFGPDPVKTQKERRKNRMDTEHSAIILLSQKMIEYQLRMGTKKKHVDANYVDGGSVTVTCPFSNMLQRSNPVHSTIRHRSTNLNKSWKWKKKYIHARAPPERRTNQRRWDCKYQTGLSSVPWFTMSLSFPPRYTKSLRLSFVHDTGNCGNIFFCVCDSDLLCLAWRRLLLILPLMGVSSSVSVITKMSSGKCNIRQRGFFFSNFSSLSHDWHSCAVAFNCVRHALKRDLSLFYGDAMSNWDRHWMKGRREDINLLSNHWNVLAGAGDG